MATTIFLIRHGESQQNIDDVLSGVTDIPLSENGRRQCGLLSHYFEHVHIDKVFATPLQRAMESAEIIFPKHKSSIKVIEALIEFNYGDYEGYQRSGYDSDNDEIIQKWITTPSSLTFPRGGNIKKHAETSYSAIEKLAFDNKDGTIACVSHRTTIRLILAQIISLHLDDFRSLPCSNCGISEIIFDNEWHVQSINVTPKYLGE